MDLGSWILDLGVCKYIGVCVRERAFFGVSFFVDCRAEFRRKTATSDGVRALTTENSAHSFTSPLLALSSIPLLSSTPPAP